MAGRFTHLELTDTRGAEKLTRGAVVPDEIRIADRYYARLAGMRHILGGGGDFIIRAGRRSLVLRAPDGRDFDLFGAMEGVSEGHSTLIWTRPAHLHTGPRLTKCRKAEA